MTPFAFDKPNPDPVLEGIRQAALPLAKRLGGDLPHLPRVFVEAIAGHFRPLVVTTEADCLALIAAHTGRPPTDEDRAVVQELLGRITGSRGYWLAMVAEGAWEHDLSSRPRVSVPARKLGWAKGMLGADATARRDREKLRKTAKAEKPRVRRLPRRPAADSPGRPHRGQRPPERRGPSRCVRASASPGRRRGAMTETTSVLPPIGKAKGERHDDD